MMSEMVRRSEHTLVQVAVAVFIVVGALLSNDSPATIIGFAALSLIAAAFLPSSGWPVPAAGAVVVVGVATLCHGDPGNVGWFAVCVLAGWCALRVRTVAAALFTSSVTALLIAEATLSRWDPGWTAWVAGTLFTTIVCLMARRQQDLIEQLRRAQAGLATKVRAEERNRISRELHDVIGHCLTVSLLHLSSARLAVEDDPAEAVGALASAEELARQSLTEVRHAVGLLREPSTGVSDSWDDRLGEGSLEPLPGSDQLPLLVRGFRDAGAQVDYDVVGDPGQLAATTGLTVYRILQESLTNAVRHGAGNATAVRLEISRQSAVLTVDSTGAAGKRRGESDGVGLVGMRERAEALGGRCTAGPTVEGWRVRAVLPS